MDATWPLVPSLIGLAASVAVLVIFGTRLARTADALADRTGLGQALAGALLLGAVTSLPGILTTITGAIGGDADFALANPIGGVAIQTVWLAIADLVYRRANLEHAAASLDNILQAVLLMALLSLPVIAYATPQLVIGWIHPVTLVIPVLYLFGLRLLRSVRNAPMWQPRRTHETRTDDGDDTSTESTLRLWTTLAVLAVIVGVTGWVIGQSGLGLIAATGWPSAVTGFTVTTAISSLPELITLLAAIRIGALTLGVAASSAATCSTPS